MASLKDDTPESRVKVSGDAPRKEDIFLVTPSTPGSTLPKYGDVFNQDGTPTMGNPKKDDDDKIYEEVFNEDGDFAPPLIPRDDYDSDSGGETPFTFQINDERA